MQSNFARKRSQSSLARQPESFVVSWKNSWRDSIVGHRYFCKKNMVVYGRCSLQTNYIYSSLIRRLSCSVFALSTDDSGNPRIHGCDMLGLLSWWQATSSRKVQASGVRSRSLFRLAASLVGNPPNMLNSKGLTGAIEKDVGSWKQPKVSHQAMEWEKSCKTWTEVNLKKYVHIKTWILAHFCQAVMWYTKLCFQRTLALSNQILKTNRRSASGAAFASSMAMSCWRRTKYPYNCGGSKVFETPFRNSGGYDHFLTTSVVWNQEEWEATQILDHFGVSILFFWLGQRMERGTGRSPTLRYTSMIR